MRDFRSLNVWEESHELNLEIYSLTSDFPKNEKFGLISQLRRSAASVPTNIAEGCGAWTEKEFSRFLKIALRSSSELEYQVELSNDLEYIDSAQRDQLIEKVQQIKRMLVSLIQTLKEDMENG